MGEIQENYCYKSINIMMNDRKVFLFIEEISFSFGI
jgi:hypothetical protein